MTKNDKKYSSGELNHISYLAEQIYIQHATEITPRDAWTLAADFKDIHKSMYPFIATLTKE